MNTARWSSTTKRVVVVVIAALAIALLLRAGAIVIPFVWAGILAYVLLPLVARIERRGVPRNLASALVFGMVLAIVFGVGRYAVPLALGELRDLQRSLPRLVETAQLSLSTAIVGTPLEGFDDFLFARGIDQLVSQIVDSAPRMAVPVVIAFGHFVLDVLIFFIALFFMLRDAPRLSRWVRHLIPAAQRPELLPLLGQVSTLLGRYVRGQLILVLVMASATTISLVLFGLPYAFVLGIVTGILETIPIVGPITAGSIAVLVALGHPNPFGWSQVFYAAAIAGVYTVLRHAEDYFVVPLVIGRIVRLHPAVVIFSLLAGGAVGGLLGVLLAVPVAATTRLVLVYVNAKLRDENPFPRLAKELADAGEPRPDDAGLPQEPRSGSPR